MRSIFLGIQGTKIHYQILGKGRPLILIHAAVGEWPKEDKVSKILAKYFKVIIVDLLGFGLSQEYRGKHTIDLHAFVLKDFLKKLRISKALIVGHSKGAVVALELAKQFPKYVDKLILVGLPDLRYLNKIRWVIKPFLVSFITKTLPGNIIFAIALVCLRESLNKIYPTIQRLGNISVRAWIETIRDLIKIDTKTLLNQVRKPYILIYGEKDQVKQNLKNAKIIENVGHDTFLDNPKEISKIILDFLKNK